MSKEDELSQVLNEMITSGENMIKAANALMAIIASGKEELHALSPQETPPEPHTKSPAKVYEFIEVRKAFSAKAHEGYTEQIKTLIAKYGAAKLSDIKKDDYPALMADLEVIGCLSTQD